MCESNGLSPNVSEYSQTIPYFICTENNNDCVTACQGASACQSACRQNNPCGAQDPTRVNETDAATTTSSKLGGAASTAADGAVYTGFGDSGSGSGGSSSGSGDKSGDTIKNAAALLDVGRLYGLGAVLAGVFAGFSLLL